MRRFLFAGQLNGQLQALAKLPTLIQQRQPDAVLFAGSIVARTPMSHAEKLKTWEHFFERIGELGVCVAMVPGAPDAPLREFLRQAKGAEVDYPNVHVAHACLFEESDTAICGLGGELTEAEDRTEDTLCYARASAEYFLRTLWRAEQPHKVLLLSVPPPGKLGGPAGNPICGEFIDSYHPSLCVVAGDTSQRGFQQFAHTLVVNPGHLADGSVAWLDWNRSRGEQVELLYLE
jgi:Icc-related predicted phosphoesterase